MFSLNRRGHAPGLGIGLFTLLGMIGIFVSGAVLFWPFFAVLELTGHHPLPWRLYCFGPIAVVGNLAYLAFLFKFFGVRSVVAVLVVFIVSVIIGRFC